MTDGQFYALLGSSLGGFMLLLIALGGPLWKLASQLTRHEVKLEGHDAEILKLREAKHRHSGVLQQVVLRLDLKDEDFP